MFRLLALPLLVISLMFFTGCSTPQTRSKEKGSAFEQLSKEDQKKVLEGRIAEGMSEDAVYIALGRPSKKKNGRYKGKDTLTWVYSRLESREVPAFSHQAFRDRKGRLYVSEYYDPVLEYRSVDSFAVFFDQGKVIGWQEL